MIEEKLWIAKLDWHNKPEIEYGLFLRTKKQLRLNEERSSGDARRLLKYRRCVPIDEPSVHPTWQEARAYLVKLLQKEASELQTKVNVNAAMLNKAKEMQEPSCPN